MNSLKYRIKKEYHYEENAPCFCSIYFHVQVKRWFGWVTIKTFHELFDNDFAQREAEELIDYLES